jgi:hypothetical protein
MRHSLLGLVLAPLFALTSAHAQTCTCPWTPAAGSIYETCCKVGIGTSNPHVQLHVTHPNLGYTVNVLIERTTVGSNAALIFRTATPDVVTGVSSQWAIGKSGNAGQETLFFSLHSTGDELGDPKVAFWNNGRVGIGTGRTAPTATLDVSGDIHASGTINATNVVATYQDIAEWVPASADLVPGTVVVLDPSQDNHVMPSSRAYDTSVAGVVSGKPGVILGVESADKAKIATTGRVKVKVDATRAPIAIGDLLVTGNRPGMAMKSEPIEVAGTEIHRPGTVLGKALQSLPNGEGEILVLLSLQ